MPLEDLYAMPGHLIRRTQQIALGLFQEECGSFDLTSVQYAALHVIEQFPGIDATSISGLIAFDRPTIGGVIDRLEAKGWVERKPAPDDRRIKLVTLTPAGAKLLKRAEGPVARVQERLVAPLSPAERKTFVQLLAKLVDLNNESSRAPRREPAGFAPESTD